MPYRHYLRWILAAALLTAAPASASPSLTRAINYARNAWVQLCSDPLSSRFARLSAADGYRECAATISPGRLRLEVRLRRAHGEVDGGIVGSFGAAGVLRQEAEFTDRSHFFCSSPDDDGFSTLYMSCRGELTSSAFACASISHSLDSPRGEIDRAPTERSFVEVIETWAPDCRQLQRAFRFIAHRSRRPGGGVLKPFGQ